MHFHELVHVIQWEHLGVERFLLAYAQGFLSGGYYSNPLESMAYAHQQRFIRDNEPYEVENEVVAEMEEFTRTLRL